MSDYPSAEKAIPGHIYVYTRTTVVIRLSCQGQRIRLRRRRSLTLPLVDDFAADCRRITPLCGVIQPHRWRPESILGVEQHLSYLQSISPSSLGTHEVQLSAPPCPSKSYDPCLRTSVSELFIFRLALALAFTFKKLGVIYGQQHDPNWTMLSCSLVNYPKHCQGASRDTELDKA